MATVPSPTFRIRENSRSRLEREKVVALAEETVEPVEDSTSVSTSDHYMGVSIAYWCGLRRELMGMGVAGMIIDSYCGYPAKNVS